MRPSVLPLLNSSPEFLPPPEAPLSSPYILFLASLMCDRRPICFLCLTSRRFKKSGASILCLGFSKNWGNCGKSVTFEKGRESKRKEYTSFVFLLVLRYLLFPCWFRLSWFWLVSPRIALSYLLTASRGPATYLILCHVWLKERLIERPIIKDHVLYWFFPQWR
ncbi:hypothetical protein OPV22_010618 [Ensete ventricosum]|uniref:Uncharacterized protein n=1 Tax=Ensete ventricosum TaxID=4639 RepID=A0AAV8RL99_ENSVE|nr:hypothetical protein OPV22_010618 [Ensete ventricosum]